MAYSSKVIDHYENPRNVGAFDKGDTTIGTGLVGAPACGDVMKLQIKTLQLKLNECKAHSISHIKRTNTNLSFFRKIKKRIGIILSEVFHPKKPVCDNLLRQPVITTEHEPTFDLKFSLKSWLASLK